MKMVRHSVTLVAYRRIDLRFLQGEVIEGMRLICTLNANLSALAGALQIQAGPQGKQFYRVDYNVCVYFGGTQLRANLQWKEKVGTLASRNTSLLTQSQGVLREGPVAVMPYVSESKARH